MSEKKHTVISLFSGAMGLDLGLEKAGFEPAVSVENNKSCIETIKANRRDLPVLGDIVGLDTKDLLRIAKTKKGKPTLVVGGPPCQSFSTAGKRLSVKDPRGNLIAEYLRVVNESRPRFFVMENVKGLVSAAISHTPLKDRSKKPMVGDEKLGSVFEMIMEEIGRMGYKSVYAVLDAVNYGVPQFRERLVIIGSRDGEDIFMPRPTHFMMHQNPEYRWATLGQAIRDLEKTPGPCGRFSPDRAKILDKIPAGKNWRYLPKKEIPSALGGAFEASGGKMGFYRRLSYDEPCPTLVTSPVQKATMLCHPAVTRPLSVREYARVQQFPETWELSGNLVDQYRQLGNAVPVGLGVAIGQMLSAVIAGQHIIKTKRTRGTGTHKVA